MNTAKKKSKTAKEIYRANGSQLRYLKRNWQHIAELIKAYEVKEDALPLNPDFAIGGNFDNLPKNQ